MKKTLSIILAAALTVGLAGCGAKQTSTAASAGNSNDKKVIKVGATPVPHEEILQVVKPILAKEGYDLQIVEYTDYVQPNINLNEGQLDANFFQHVPYLNNMVKEKNLDLTYTVKVHIEPMGVYSKKIARPAEVKDDTLLTSLPDGATIAVPNDPTNEARALRVLEKAGLFKLKDGELVTALDIDKASNTKNIKIKELDAAQLPRSLDDVDAAVINSNYALEAKLNPVKDSLAIESSDSPYANILAVRTADKDKPYIKALSDALTSPEVKKFIEEKYNGSVVPAF